MCADKVAYSMSNAFSTNSFPPTWLSKHLTLQPRPTYNLPQVLHCLTFWWKPRLCRTFQIFSSSRGFLKAQSRGAVLGLAAVASKVFMSVCILYGWKTRSKQRKCTTFRATGLWRRQLRVSLSLNKYSSSFVWQFVRQRTVVWQEKNEIDERDEFYYWFVNYLLQLSAKGAKLGIG